MAIDFSKYRTSIKRQRVTISTEGLRLPYGKLETIEELPPLSARLSAQAKRKATIGAKALIGDVPYLRRFLPTGGQIEKVKPSTGAEKVLFGGTRLARDIGLIAGSSGALGAVGKIPKLAKFGRILTKIPGIGRGLQRSAPLLKEFIRGGLYGAVTADTEEKKEILRRAGEAGAVFVAIPGALKLLGKVGTKLLATSAAKSITTKLRGVTTPLKRKARELIFQRRGELNVGLYESARFVNKLTTTLTKQERELIPFLGEKIGIPKKLNRPDLISLVRDKSIREKLVKTSKSINDYLDDSHNFLIEHMGKDIGFWEKYVPRI